MRGLPFSACIGDVASFFRGLSSLDKEHVYFAYDGTGRPSGEAYITFACTDDYQAAMRLHKRKMGQRYIELFASSTADLQRVAKQRKLRLAQDHGGPRIVVGPKDVAVVCKTSLVPAQGQPSRGARSGVRNAHASYLCTLFASLCRTAVLIRPSDSIWVCRNLKRAKSVLFYRGRHWLTCRPAHQPKNDDAQLCGANERAGVRVDIGQIAV